MTIAEKFQTIAENEQKVYDAGYEKGYTDGETKGKSEGIEQGYTEGYTDGETKGKSEGIEQGYTEGYAYGTMPMYYAKGLEFMWNNVVFPENTELVIRVAKAPKSHNATFTKTQNIKTIKMVSDDNSNIVEFYQFVRESADLELLDLTEYNRNCSNISLFAFDARNLKTILGGLDLTQCTTTTNAFLNAGALEDIEFVKETIKISIDFWACKYLTAKSIQSIIDGLADLTGGTSQKISWHSSVLEKLTTDQFLQILNKNWTYD